ncbi:MAG: hypothetical protein HFH45_05965 [Bacilli bacterium]|nr:hypothetical protein [Bacilli bacterium]
MLKKILIITTVGVVTVSGILFKIYEPSETVKHSKSSYKKENYINNNDTNTKKDVTSKQETLNSNTNADAQPKTVSETDKADNNVETNNKTNTISKPQKSTTNTKVDKQAIINSTPKVTVPTIHYDRTTSIYENDNKTLIRVEYYVNNKLTYYSVVEQFDIETNSYIEKIYKYDYENNVQILVRTDKYSNGTLIKSY